MAAFFRQPLDIYTVVPADLSAAELAVQRCEEEWRHAGAVQVSAAQVDQVLQRAQSLQAELDQAKSKSRRTLHWAYLNLVRLFVVSRLPQFGKAAIIGGLTAIVCGLSLAFSPCVAPTLGVALGGALVLTVLASLLGTAAVFLLWPTEAKRQAFQRFQVERKQWLERVD